MKIINLINSVVLSFGLLFSFCIAMAMFFYWVCQERKIRKANKKFKNEYLKLGIDDNKVNSLMHSTKELTKITPEKLTINLGLIKIESKIDSHSFNVMWITLVELSTRIIFNSLDDQDGKEKTALDSIYKCFQSIRKELLRERVTPPILHTILSLLNKQIRPFLAKWHSKIDENNKETFRKELSLFRKQTLKCREVKLLFFFFEIKIADLKEVLQT